MIKADYDGHLLDLATNEKVVGQCDYCGVEIYLGQEILLCNDGATVHDDCFMDYAKATISEEQFREWAENELDPMTINAKEEY